MEPKRSLPHSQETINCPYPEPDSFYFPLLTSFHSPRLEPCEVVRDMVRSYGEMLASRFKLEDHNLSPVRDFFFSLFEVTLHI
jgi:hypothetical protein